MINARELFPSLLPEDAQTLAERADRVLRLEAAIDTVLRKDLPRGSVKKTDYGHVRVTLTLPGEYDEEWFKLQLDDGAWRELRSRLMRSGWDLKGERGDPTLANVVLEMDVPPLISFIEERARGAHDG